MKAEMLWRWGVTAAIVSLAVVLFSHGGIARQAVYPLVLISGFAATFRRKYA